MSFETLGLAPALLRAIAAQGYTAPTPIQQRAIPAILAGRDVLAAAQTGTGKTAAFTLPMLHRLQAEGGTAGGKRKPRALILTPTRELAAQISESVHSYGSDAAQLRSVLIFGGVSINPQIDTLRRGVDVIIATPGRLLDHVQQGTVDLSHVRFLVLDEADRMLDMGFIRDIRRVIEKLPKQRQNLLFSATFSADIRKLAEGLLVNPETIDIAPRNSAAEAVTQRAVFTDKAQKSALLSYMIGRFNWQQVLVFTRTKHGANRLCERLNKDGLSAAALHGNKSQNARLKALADFKAGTVRVLVATDIAARGLDIDQLPYVVNFELPNVPEDYVHRIGRTGRAGQVGEAVSLISRDEYDHWRGIERLLKQSIPAFEIEGFHPGTVVDTVSDDRPAKSARRPAGRSTQKTPNKPAATHTRPSQRRAAEPGHASKADGDAAQQRRRRPRRRARPAAE